MSYSQAVHTRLDDQWGAGERIGAHNVPLIGPKMRGLCNRARNLERESALAYATLDRCVENVIGTGIKLRPASSSPAFNKAIKGLLADLFAGKRFDARRMLTWLQIQQLLYRGALRDGDCALLLIDDGAGPSVQLIDRNAIATPPNRTERNIHDGVELDGNGRPVAYWIRTVIGNGQQAFNRVEARDLIFFHRSSRHDVVRGESAFNGTFRIFENMEGYFEAVVVAARIAASAAMIRRRKGRNAPLGKTDEQRPPRAIPIQPGMINEIDSDDELLAFNPSQPTQNFPDACRTFGRFVGLKFGLTVQRVLLDFSNTNYSVSRSTALQEQRFAEPEQENFVEAVLRRLYQWLVSKWVKAGRVIADGQAIEEPEDSWKFEWVPPARPLVEPAKDAPGLAQLIAMNVESFRNVAESFGYDLDQTMDDNAATYKRLRELGLPIGDGSAPLPPADDPNENEDPEQQDDPAPSPNVAHRRLFVQIARAMHAATQAKLRGRTTRTSRTKTKPAARAKKRTPAKATARRGRRRTAKAR